jgi:hypothetical protein
VITFIDKILLLKIEDFCVDLQRGLNIYYFNKIGECQTIHQKLLVFVFEDFLGDIFPLL